MWCDLLFTFDIIFDIFDASPHSPKELDLQFLVFGGLPRAISLQVFDAATEPAASPIGVQTPGVVRARLGQVARLLADEALGEGVSVSSLPLRLAVL